MGDTVFMRSFFGHTFADYTLLEMLARTPADQRAKYIFFTEFMTFNTPFMSNITGYAGTELFGSTLHRLIPADEQDGVAAYFYDIRVTGKPGKPYNCNFKCKSAGLDSVEMVVPLIRHKCRKPVGFRIVSRDVGDRKRLENDLLESGRSAQAARMATIPDLAKLAAYRDEAFFHDKAMRIIVNERGIHFAPKIEDAFLAHEKDGKKG